MRVEKDWRIVVLLFCTIGALFSIFLKPYYTGVQIAYVPKDSELFNIVRQGSIISEVGGSRINSVEEFRNVVRILNGSIDVVIDKKKYNVNASTLRSIEVVDIDRINIDMGLDIKGGTRIILKPEGNISKDTIEQILTALQTRSNIYGLKEIKFIPIRNIDGTYFIQIEATGLSAGIVEDLLARQGVFEAKILKPVFLKENKANFIVGENSYNIIFKNNTIFLGNLTILLNQTFELDGIKFEFVNVSGNELFFLASVYDNNDIELIYTDPTHSGILPMENGYQFYFTVLVSKEGAERFAKVTAGIPPQADVFTGEYYLKDTKIILYIDNIEVSDLRISASLGGKVYTTPQIQGSRDNMEDAIKEKLRLQSILRSGALPVKLRTVSTGTLSPTLGKNFISSTLLAFALTVVGIIFVSILRYRKFSISLPMSLMSIFEAIIILGIASYNDSIIWGIVLILNLSIIFYASLKGESIDIVAWIGSILIPVIGMTFSWTIDLPAIAGIIAAIGTGIDNMIIIADETITGGVKKEMRSLKERVRSAFFIIFGTASTTIAAMFPLMIIGIGLIRGFAITTVIGVLVGIMITRPAYARIIERISS